VFFQKPIKFLRVCTGHLKNNRAESITYKNQNRNSENSQFWQYHACAFLRISINGICSSA